MVQKIKNRK